MKECDPEGCVRYTQSGSPYLSHNQHLFRYMPNIIISHNVGIACLGIVKDARGYLLWGCSDFRSTDGALWRVQTSANNGNAVSIYSVADGDPKLWVKFKESIQLVIYESRGAQQYAMTHGGSDSLPAAPSSGKISPAEIASRNAAICKDGRLCTLEEAAIESGQVNKTQINNNPCVGLSGSALQLCRGASSAMPTLGGLLAQ